jgi:hypothetical protein
MGSLLTPSCCSIHLACASMCWWDDLMWVRMGRPLADHRGAQLRREPAGPRHPCGGVGGAAHAHGVRAARCHAPGQRGGVRPGGGDAHGRPGVHHAVARPSGGALWTPSERRPATVAHRWHHISQMVPPVLSSSISFALMVPDLPSGEFPTCECRRCTAWSPR